MIRRPRKQAPILPGQTLTHYWKQRTPPERKPMHLIGKAVCTDVVHTTILDLWWDEENALADGFGDLMEFRAWAYPDWWKVAVKGDLARLLKAEDREIIKWGAGLYLIGLKREQVAIL